ncbi:MAG: lysostaphin resistance A-like protein [Pirellulales bacterium]
MEQPPAPQNSQGFRLAVLVEGAIGLVAVGLAELFGISLRDQFGFSKAALVDGLVAGVAATVPMLAMYWWLTVSTWPPLVELRETVVRMVRELFPNARLPELATIAILAGVGEELLFRGVVQTGIAQLTSPAIGLAAGSLVFGALHAVSRLYFILATLIGLYLGWLLLQFGDLTVPIVAHMLYDFVALAYLTRTFQDELPL